MTSPRLLLLLLLPPLPQAPPVLVLVGAQATAK
jgi:hypothetical protein